MRYLSKHTHALLAFAMVLALTLNAVSQSSGTLDSSFGTGGTVTTDFGASAGAASVAVQPDGKIVAAGTVSSLFSFTDFALSRYDTDGRLDASFGVGGKVTTDFASFFDFASSVAIQQDGKIIVAGGAVISPFSNFALARYNSNGTLDASFGAGGKVTTAFGQVSAQASSVAVQQDGKIVVAGVANIDGGEDFALVRYNSNGTLDASFGAGGRVTTDFDLVGQGFSFAFASSVAVQPDGRIVAAGDAQLNGGRNFALACYNSNGTLDASFGTGGKVTTNFSGSTFDDFANSVAVQQDGKIVAAGGVRTSGGFDFALVRYNSDGTLDATFGTGGKVTTDFASPSDFAFSVAIQQDGSIVAAGGTFTGPDSDSFHSALARYNSNGTLDASFGTGGKVTNIFGGQRDGLSSVAIQQDGKIVAAGGVSFNGNGQFALARFLSPSPTHTRATIGVYDPSSQTFYLRNTNSPGLADLTIQYGPPGAIPLVGDWDGDGIETIGLYDPAHAAFFLRNSNSSGTADISFNFGPAGLGFIPLVGDWNGDGVDTIGLYNPAGAAFFLRNSNSSGTADISFNFGPAGLGFIPLVGDWNGDGVDTIGLYNPAAAEFFLRNSNTGGIADISFAYGPAGLGFIPLVGDWDGL